MRKPCCLPSFAAGLLFLAAGLTLLAAERPAASHSSPPASPDELYGTLFTEVQRAKIFADQKTFPDCEPREDPKVIRAKFKALQKSGKPVDLKAFVAAHFIPPAPIASAPASPRTPLQAHLASLWNTLQRPPVHAAPGSSLLTLPHPYVVPGGRFREVYYWDSYFTMLGLRTSGREDLLEAMVDNFAYQLTYYGHIPNGNRSYYLSRSQAPFFALMVELLAEKKGPGIFVNYRTALEAEHAYWMDESPAPTWHRISLPDGSILNRYFDQKETPRPESFMQDEEAALGSTHAKQTFFRHVRSAAESGWDFSSRWFGDGHTLATIETTSIVPVDLNCLLWQLETTLARAEDLAGRPMKAASLRTRAETRRAAILKACWSQKDGYFFDYNLGTQELGRAFTLAGVAPLYFKLATQAQADAVAATIRSRFLRPGGVVTTLSHTGQQWDAPNGWAPLQWMTIQGLANYGHKDLAAEIAHRWIKLNRDVYQRTGRMMEKYNVEDLSLLAGGGEYESQDGFGWSNGVLLALLSQYPE